MNTIPNEYIDALHKQRTALVELYARCSSVEQAQEGRWSAKEILYHLYKTELNIAKLIRASQRMASVESPRTDTELAEERTVISAVAVVGERKVSAPENLVPVDIPDGADVLALLQESRSALLEYAQSKTEEEMRSHMIPHPVRGPMTLYGWLYFVAMHEARHTTQLEECV